MGIETVMDAIARHLGRDPLEIRKLNLYGKDERNITPYHQTVEDNVLPEMIAALETSADYAGRRRAIAAFNAESRWLKSGLALTPVKFGISFTTTHLNQAGALVHIYTDGSVHLNHGGTEMGQGLFIKVAQVVAEELQVDLDRDQDHRHQHRQGAQHLGHRRLLRLRHQRHGGAGRGPHPEAAADRFRRRANTACRRTTSRFLPGRVRVGDQEIPFADLVKAGLSGAGLALGDGLLRDAEDPLRPQHRLGPSLLLLRLWRGGERGGGRHADRRIPGDARRHPA